MSNSSKHEGEFGPSTRALHSGHKPSDFSHGPIMTPVYVSTTFEVTDPGNSEYDYSRSDNPTRTVLQKSLASLESAKYALAFSSGSGALTTASYLLESGQHVLCCDDVYGGTNRFFTKCLSRMGIETSFIDGTEEGSWTKNMRPLTTKMVWIESPTNPTMKMIDIRAAVQQVKLVDENCIVVVDNTFMSPVNQSPLKLGADVVLHSCSKYINGHSDVIMGALMTNNDKIYRKLKFFQNALGATPSPLDCSQVIRSIKTLNIRMTRQSESAMIVARFLESHHNIEKVLYPGLESHPQHELALRQCSGFSGMIAIYLATRDILVTRRFLSNLKLFHVAESLGCVASLVEIPSLMTHAGITSDEKAKLGIGDNMLRLSIGLENAEDLVGDLSQALEETFGLTPK